MRLKRRQNTSEPASKPADKPRGFWPEARSIAFVLVIAVLIALFTKSYVARPYVVEGDSMENTLADNDRLLVNKLPGTLAKLTRGSYIPRRGEIIIFNQTGLPGYTGQKQLVKRVIALPGERIEIKDGLITVFNRHNPQGFNPDTVGNYQIIDRVTLGSINETLGSDEVFVCGDNRGNSEDSRHFGPVKDSQIVGELAFRIWPLGKVKYF